MKIQFLSSCNKYILVIVLSFFGATACKKETTGSPVTTPPGTTVKPPVANAGADQILILPTDSTILGGSGTSTGGIITGYHWAKLSGPLAFSITDPNLGITKLTGLVEGTYEFELKVTDNKGVSATDKLIIMVINNHGPVAHAGPDKTLQLFSCYDRTILDALDGTGSTDPENNIVRYDWVALYGTPGYNINNPHSARSGLTLYPGNYSFELTVTDLGGLLSKDTVLINVIGPTGSPAIYNLDLTISSPYTFLNNYNSPWDDPPDYFYDETYVVGKASSPPLGEFDIGIFEYADSAELSNMLYGTYITIRTTNVNSYLYLDGTLSGVNFKKLIRDGGGPFTGAFTVTWGSAKYCDPNIYANLPPLAVTGNLNVATHMITIRIRGNAYF